MVCWVGGVALVFSDKAFRPAHLAQCLRLRSECPALGFRAYFVRA
jgi:hypothetical protein